MRRTDRPTDHSGHLSFPGDGDGHLGSPMGPSSSSSSSIVLAGVVPTNAKCTTTCNYILSATALSSLLEATMACGYFARLVSASLFPGPMAFSLSLPLVERCAQAAVGSR